MRLFLSLIFILACCTTVAAQRYDARLLDKASKQPVEYANIGILESETGTNSDSAGNFALNITDNLKDKMLVISMIGYEEYKVPVSTFINTLSSDRNIYLQKKVNTMSELVVRPVKFTFAELGTNITCGAGGKEGGLNFPFLFEKKKHKGVKDTLTEIGTLMKVKRKKTFIDSIQINVGKCTYDHILFRLNIYEDQEGGFKNILNEPIYIKLTREQVGKAIKVNLTEKNLVVNHNFIVSIEKVKEMGEGEFTICGKMFGPAMYMRIASRHEDFTKLPVVSMGIASYVTFSEAIK